jgi:hypothetical protein
LADLFILGVVPSEYFVRPESPEQENRGMTWVWPSLLSMAQVVQPGTILRWHRAGFRAYWRWKSHGRAGRPKIDRALRDLIRGKPVVGSPADPW